jgi:hypothetical protein
MIIFRGGYNKLSGAGRVAEGKEGETFGDLPGHEQRARQHNAIGLTVHHHTHRSGSSQPARVTRLPTSSALSCPQVCVRAGNAAVMMMMMTVSWYVQRGPHMNGLTCMGREGSAMNDPSYACSTINLREPDGCMSPYSHEECPMMACGWSARSAILWRHCLLCSFRLSHSGLLLAHSLSTSPSSSWPLVVTAAGHNHLLRQWSGNVGCAVGCPRRSQSRPAGSDSAFNYFPRYTFIPPQAIKRSSVHRASLLYRPFPFISPSQVSLERTA